MNEKSKDKKTQFSVEESTLLLDFLIGKFTDKSRTTIKSLLKNKQVLIGNQPVTKFDYALNPGDTIVIRWGKGVVTLKDPQLSIVFEDEDFIVVEKAAGLLSIATQKEKMRTAYSILSTYLKKTNPKNRIFVIHRLDRETSGLMVFAKNEAIQAAMQNNWKFAVQQRSYIAVVEGVLQTGDGTGVGVIKSYLWESKSLIVYSSPNPDDGQLAVTRYEVLKTGDKYTLVRLQLETGRKNQIRVHMNSIGHPLAGDMKYGGHACALKRLCLHADKLSFTHPRTGERLDFSSPAPVGFSKLTYEKAVKS
jgi:23S rRNA pseudouridine1911/1915/1917 synthase